MNARHPRTVFGAAGVVACAAWGLRPVAPRRIEVTPMETASREDIIVQLAALDLDAFRAPVWVAAPAPPPPPSRVADPRPLKLQLLAITRERDAYRAFLYDPDADRLLVVGDGQAVGPRSVERVTPDAVVFRDGASERTLALREDRAAAVGPPR